MRRAIVSGITGHVGAVLGDQLMAAGFQVHGLTRGGVGSTMQPASRMGIRLHHVDGRTQTLVSLFEEIQPDVVLHLAALARHKHLTTDISPLVTANILFGTQLLEAAKLVGCRSFITTGSHLQYGENARHHAFNLYAATKTAFEEILAYFVDSFGFSAIALTLCNVYSELDPRPTLLSQLLGAFADGTPLSLHTGEVWFDLVHVEDVAAALIQSIRVLDHHRAEGIGLSHYSVSAGRDMSCAELMTVIEALGLTRPNINYGRPEVPAYRVRPWRGICVPGWTPRIGIQEGVTRLLAHRAARAEVTEDA